MSRGYDALKGITRSGRVSVCMHTMSAKSLHNTAGNGPGKVTVVDPPESSRTYSSALDGSCRLSTLVRAGHIQTMLQPPLSSIPSSPSRCSRKARARSRVGARQRAMLMSGSPWTSAPREKSRGSSPNAWCEHLKHPNPSSVHFLGCYACLIVGFACLYVIVPACPINEPCQPVCCQPGGDRLSFRVQLSKESSTGPWVRVDKSRVFSPQG